MILPIKEYEALLMRAEDAADARWLKERRKKPMNFRTLDEFLAERATRARSSPRTRRGEGSKQAGPGHFSPRREAIRGLKISTRPSGSKKLAGSSGGWRVRIGDYRIIYDIDDRAKCVRILRVRHRREVYR